MAVTDEDKGIGPYSEQCFIKDFMSFFSGVHGKDYSDYDAKIDRKHSLVSEPVNILKVDRLDLNKSFDLSSTNKASEGSLTFVSKLSSPHAQMMIESVPKELMANLQPEIKIFKIYYRGPEDKEGVPIELPFNNFLNPSENKGMGTTWEGAAYSGLNAASPGHLGVGLKEFSYDYLGTNPAEVDYFIDVQMKLWFSTVDAMFHKYPLPPAVKEVLNETGAWSDGRLEHEYVSFADLITRPTWGYDPQHPQPGHLSWDPKYFRIRIDIGYAPPTDEFLESAHKELSMFGKETSKEYAENLRKAISSVKVSFFLNLLRHTFGFRSDVPSGPFELDIKYNGAVESALYSRDANILRSEEHSNEKLEKLRKEPVYMWLQTLHEKIINNSNNDGSFDPSKYNFSTFFEDKEGFGLAGSKTLKHKKSEELFEIMGSFSEAFPTNRGDYNPEETGINTSRFKSSALKTWGYGEKHPMVDVFHAYYITKRMWDKELRKHGISDAQIRARRYGRILEELSEKKGRPGVTNVTRPSRIYTIALDASADILPWRKISVERMLTEAEQEEIKEIGQEGGGEKSRAKIEEVRRRRDARVNYGVAGSTDSVYKMRKRILKKLHDKVEHSSGKLVQRDKTKAGNYTNNVQTYVDGKRTKGAVPAKKFQQAKKNLQNKSKAPTRGMKNITWFYFGDLIDAALNIVRSGARDGMGLDIWYAPNYDSSDQPIYKPHSSGALRVILGDVTYLDPIEGKPVTINLTDLPISYELFREFWFAHVVNEMREKYSFKAFLKDAMNELVVAALTNKCVLTGEPVMGIRPHIAHISLASDAPRKVYAARPVGDFVSSAADNDERGADRVWRAQIRDTVPAAGDPAVAHETHQTDGAVQRLKEHAHMLAPLTESQSIYENFGKDTQKNAQEIIYVCATTDTAVTLLSGDKAKDIKNGILYLEVGTDGTPVESISFDKQDMPWYLEAKGAQSGFKDDPIELSEPYKCNFSIYGNTVIKPGQYIYIRLPHFGLPGTLHSPSRRLGLGGYFFITKVRNSLILRGNKFDWTTDANCIWNSFGGTKRSVSIDTNPNNK